MAVRDATPADISDIARLTGTSERAARAMWLERTVRVLEGEEGEVRGLVVFDATETAIALSRVVGDPTMFDRLLEEPLVFGNAVGLPVEMVVPRSEATLAQALETAGFEAAGDGPRFGGDRTVRYRCDEPRRNVCG